MFGIAGTAELSTFRPGAGTWNRLQDGTSRISVTQSTLRASRPGERANDIGPWWALKFGASGVRASVARASPVARGQAEEV